jgi:hypothetical protein
MHVILVTSKNNTNKLYSNDTFLKELEKPNLNLIQRRVSLVSTNECKAVVDTKFVLTFCRF